MEIKIKHTLLAGRLAPIVVFLGALAGAALATKIPSTLGPGSNSFLEAPFLFYKKSNIVYIQML